MKRRSGKGRLFAALLVAGLLWPASAGVRAAEDTPVNLLGPRRSFTVDHWHRKDGLPQSVVMALERTRDGYLWIGTQEGVARFDGFEFRVDDEVARGDAVVALLEDSERTLWIAASDGLSTYRDGAYHLLHPTEEFGVFLTSLVERPEGGIWIGTQDGIWRLTDGELVREDFFDAPLAGRSVNELLVDRRGDLWATLPAAGLVRIRGTEVTLFDAEKGLKGPAITVAEAPDGSIWAGTGIGVYRVDDGIVEPVWEAEESPPTVRGIAFTADGTAWVGTRWRGLLRLAPGDEEPRPVESCEAFQVFVVEEDQAGGVWAGTFGSGLARVREATFQPLTRRHGLASNLSTSVLEDRSGHLWLGTWGRGLNRIGPQGIDHFTWKEGLTSHVIGGMFEDRDGNIWVGTVSGGLYRLVEDRLEKMETGDLGPRDSVFAIQQTRDGALWLGTQDGVIRLQGDEARRWGVEDGLPSARTASLLVTPDDEVWVGTRAGMVRMTEDGPVEVIGVDDGLPDPQVFSLAVDSEGYFWVGTIDGLALLRDGRVTPINEKDGLCERKVFQIIDDGHGYLWLSSQMGISRIEQDQLVAFTRGERDRFDCVLYTESAGMANRECNGGIHPPGIRARDGRLWFSTVEGVVAIEPGRVPPAGSPPPVHIDRVMINGEVRAAERELLSIPKGRGDLEVQFTAVSLTDPTRLRFRHRLVPFDDGWIEAGSRREVRYTNLPAGRYRFEVEAAVGHGRWGSSAPATVEMQLVPRFHESTPFFVLLGVVALGAVALVHLGRVRREKALHRLVQERTSELEHANQSLEEWNRRRSSFVSGVSHELRTPLTLIRFYSESLLDEPGVPRAEKEHSHQIIARESERLTRLVDRVIAFTRTDLEHTDYRLRQADLSETVRSTLDSFSVYLRRHGFALDVAVVDSARANIDPDAVSIALAHVIENAVKYSRERRHIGVTLANGDSRYVLSVADRGIGIPAEERETVFDRFHRGKNHTGAEGHGLGLYVVRDIMRAHDGTVELESREGEGSTVRLVFPRHAAGDGSRE